MCGLDFKLLGRFEVSIDGERLPIGGRRRPTLLALLLLDPNRVVSADKLADAIWDGNPPSTARAQIAICVASLRKLFKEAGYEREVLVTHSPGYLLDAEDHRIDLRDFEELVAKGNRAAERGDLAATAEHLEQAVGLWRGPALAGLTGHLVEAEAARLTEQQIGAREHFLTAKLHLGHHTSVISELDAMVRQHPLREQVRAMLMLAQYRCGRKSEALTTFQDGRRMSIDELGLEPGTEIQELHQAILRDDESLQPLVPAPLDEATAPEPVRPVAPERTEREPAPPAPRPTATVPVRLPSFVGREEELTALSDELAARATQHAVPVALVTGPPGIGKTRLVTQWARTAGVRSYPDGQLTLSLSTPEHRPLTPATVLTAALAALGVTEHELPADDFARRRLYQRLLTSRRIVVIADDAHSFAQVEPLIPQSPDCALLVTSTHPLRRLVGSCRAFLLQLQSLSEVDSMELLRRVSGRTDDPDRDAWRSLGDFCDGLPLALEIIASVLVVKPHLTPARLQTQLADERRSIAELNGWDNYFSARLSRTIATLPDQETTLLKRLSRQPGDTFSSREAAELMRVDAMTSESLLDRLIEANMLRPVHVSGGQTPHYRLSRMLRLHIKYNEPAEDSAIALLPPLEPEATNTA